jgi:hypothetical protein
VRSLNETSVQACLSLYVFHRAQAYHRRMKKARQLAGLSLFSHARELLLLAARLFGALLVVALVLLRRRLHLGRLDLGCTGRGGLLVLIAHF